MMMGPNATGWLMCVVFHDTVSFLVVVFMY
jgi:hypothetical protein